MRNIQHDRPQRRLLDNMRLELGKIPDNTTRPESDEAWPSYLHQVVSRREAHLVFSELFHTIDAWSGEDGVLSFSNFPSRHYGLRLYFDEFESTQVWALSEMGQVYRN